MSFRSKSYKRFLSLVLISVFIISSSYFDNVYAGGAPYVISKEGEGNVTIRHTHSFTAGTHIYIEGEGEIDREKYIESLKKITGYFKEKDDGTIYFAGGLHEIYMIVSGTGKIYAPEDCTDLFRGLFRVHLSENFDTSKVNTMERMFYGVRGQATLLNENFDTTNVRNFKEMFKGCMEFNQELSDNFITTNGVSFEGMFEGCKKFNRSLEGHLDTHNAVGSMDRMFFLTNHFNSSLGSEFDTSGITSMRQMFSHSGFNQPLGEKFITDNVTDMEEMFSYSGFNDESVQNLNMSNVKNIRKMFYTAKKFQKCNFSKWDTSNVEHMEHFLDVYDTGATPYKHEIILGDWEMDSCKDKTFTIKLNLRYFKGAVSPANSGYTIRVNWFSNQKYLITPDRRKVEPYFGFTIPDDGGTYRFYKYYGADFPINLKAKNITFDNIVQGTNVFDLTDDLNDMIPDEDKGKYRLEFTEKNDILNDLGEQDIEVEVFPINNVARPVLKTIKVNVIEKPAKTLENDYFNDLEFICEKGGELSDIVIPRTNEHYDFTWEDGDTTNLDTLGTIQAKIKCKSKGEEWLDVSIPVEVKVKGVIKIVEVEDITSSDITSLKASDIKAKAKFEGNYIEGSFDFEPALNTLVINEGSNDVNIKFTPSTTVENAMEQEVSASLKLVYKKKSSGSEIIPSDEEENSNGKTEEEDSNRQDDKEEIASSQDKKADKKEDKDKKLKPKLTQKEKEKLKEEVLDIIEKHFEEKTEEVTKNLVEKYLKHKQEEESKKHTTNTGTEETSENTQEGSNASASGNKNLVTKAGKEIVDVKEDDCYSGAVKFGIESGIFEGTSENTFSPNMTMTNAMADEVIFRISGSDKIIEDELIALSGMNTWYASAVEWAKICKIIYGDEKYDPSGWMRRDDFVLHLYRYNNKLGYVENEIDDSVLDIFKDKDSLELKKKESMKWAVKNGIIVGFDEMEIKPANAITRAHLALVVERFVDYLGKKVK